MDAQNSKDIQSLPTTQARPEPREQKPNYAQKLGDMLKEARQQKNFSP